jgi:hypothetical protein
MEIFKDIEGYDGVYQITNTGKVFNTKRMILQKSYFSGRNRGYISFKLNKCGKRKSFYLHRLIAIHFIPNPNNYSDVHHINDIKTDNRIENLMWIDGKYHCSISPKGYGLKNVNGKLTDEQVMEIRKMYIPYKTSCQDIANLYEVSRNCIYSIISKRTFKYLAD